MALSLPDNSRMEKDAAGRIACAGRNFRSALDANGVEGLLFL